MRLTSVIALAAVVLGIGYVAIFKQDWIFKAKTLVSGYREAKTPQEAMDYFAKAIKDRDYKVAATYVEGTYAKELERAHDKCRALAKEIDSLKTWIANKAYATKDVVTALYGLDPFPTNFSPGKNIKENGDKATGEFASEPVDEFSLSADLRKIDPKMLTCVLGYVCSNPKQHPYNAVARNFAQVDLVRVGEGDGKSWKLKIDVTNDQQEAIGYYLNQQPRYLTDLEGLNQRVNNNRYESRGELEKEVKSVLRQAK